VAETCSRFFHVLQKWAVSAARSVGTPDAASSPDRRLTTTKENKYFSELKKMCNRYDRIRDTKKDIKINEFPDIDFPGDNFQLYNSLLSCLDNIKLLP